MSRALLKAPGEPLRPRKRGGGTRWLVAGIALGTLTAGVLLSRANDPVGGAASADPPRTNAPNATSEAGPLLDGLAAGQSLGAWKVNLIRVVDGRLGVDLQKQDAILTIWISQKSKDPGPSPRETERYRIYFGHTAEAQQVVAPDLETVLAEFERRLRKTEPHATPPPGI